MKSKAVISLFVFTLVAFFGFAGPAGTGSGDLDLTFNGTGVNRESSNLNSGDVPTAAALQPDGKVVVIGQIDFGSLFELDSGVIETCGVARYNSDGSVDPTFDGDGKTFVQIGARFFCRDVTVQGDGKIVIVGYIQVGPAYNIVLFRYNADGSHDTSFDSDGRKITPLINADFAHAVTIQGDGKILIAGNMGDDFMLLRYNADGSYDTTFGGGDALVTTDFFAGPDHARAVAIQADGKIIAAGNGRASGSSWNDFAVARYNSDGSPDTTFDGDGKVLTHLQAFHNNAEEIAIQLDGKIVVGGGSWGSNNDFGLVRYNTDGSLDTSFDGDGKAFNNIWAIEDRFAEMVIQADGKILIAGCGTPGNGVHNFGFVRYTSTGSLDTTLEGDGSVLIPPVPGGSGCSAGLAVQPDGRLILAGSVVMSGDQAGSDFAAMRIHADVTVDTSFDTDGRNVTNFHKRAIPARAVAIQADGKIVAVGKGGLNGTGAEYFAIFRYNTNGSFDTTFGGDGKVEGDILTESPDEATAVAVQGDGKIVVVGKAGQKFAIARYNTDGSPDTTFDGDGQKIENENSGRGFAVGIQPDGKILMGGRRFDSDGGASTIFRLNPDGSRDNSFDGDGRIGANFGGADEVTSIAVASDGKIVVAGRSQTSTYDFLIARYNSNGTPDTSFDTDGHRTVDFVGGYDYAKAITIQPDGKIVIAGASSSDNNFESFQHDWAVARLNQDGSLDSSFDGDGKVRFGLSNYFDGATGVAIGPDGKIITSGTVTSALVNDPGSNDIALVRFNSSGSLDGTFGQGGKAVANITNQDLGNGLALDSSGRAVVAGVTDAYFTVARFLGGSSVPSTTAPFDFDGDGKTDISIFRPTGAEWWINRSSNGSTFAAQFGASTDRLTPGDYTGDGKADIAFFRPSTGEWYILRSEDFSFFAFPFGTNGDVPAPADYDADGKTDATVFRPSNSTWFVRRSTDTGTTIETFGSSGDVPVASDYDGDGKADIAIYRPSLGQWWIKRSASTVIAFTFGGSSDKPVQGDYTGDGKSDVAFWRPSTGQWFVLRSEDFSFYAVPFGTTGDIPSPGDYDGDGKFDTAVFRPSNQNWYVDRSTAGVLIQQFGSVGDVPVPNAFVP